MILDDETKTKYGYSPKDLSKASTKSVMLRCDHCGKVFEKRYVDATYGKQHRHGCSRRCAAQVKIASAKEVGSYATGAAKTTETCLLRYGAKRASQLNSTKQKVKNTCLTRYGAPNQMQNPDVAALSAARMKERYPSHPASRPQARLQTATTLQLRYGSRCTWRIGKTRGNTAEDQVRSFLNSLGFNFEEAALPGTSMQLDGLDVAKKVAFEFNGLFWHCEDSKSPRGRRYHFEKLKACREHGIRLFSIFEDEWLHRRPQVEGFLRAALGGNTITLQARKLQLKKVDDASAQAFYESYHIQGRTTKGTAAAGLYFEGELVACMSFGRHHRGGAQPVLTRLCFKTGITVIGGSARLFRSLLRVTQATSVISWSDNRWSEGGVYLALGFNKIEELPPDYSYVNLNRPTERLSKQSQKKSSSSCPADLTELQWAHKRGLSRIWDCGKTRWEYNNQQTHNYGHKTLRPLR